MAKRNKIYKVNLIKSDELTITGKGESSLWEQSEVLNDFISPWDATQRSEIEFRALWDGKYLFFCFTVYDSKIHIDTKDDSIDSIGNSDRVELFFRPDASLNPYYCLEIDTAARVMDFKAYPDKNFDFNWNWPKDEISVKSSKDELSFTVEGAISLDSLNKFTLIKENKIETGIFRAKYNSKQNIHFEPTWISWVHPNTEEPNFHIASSFGVLYLVS
ncbi:Carbohydrate family 9 binding domain-like [Flavobacterium gillisiae]|uniref:Carbohydrate family 9 binding domain-like n=1 Tax=Flavobacterium gillisiae TaxID=150146 RepID=A0A1H4F5K6_9FLAO|nr:sugar-binding protein [Flavobacterium gillisiae]SEA92539.1 Carbohydrate family 9 binding domain-like [Flavobacterium gillisiae]